MAAHLPAWRAALAFAAGAASAEALLSPCWSMDPAAVPLTAISRWRWLAVAGCIVACLARAGLVRRVLRPPGQARPRACGLWPVVVLVIGYACTGAAHSFNRGALLLGSPLRLGAGASPAAGAYLVRVTGIPRAFGDSCSVRAVAWGAREPGQAARGVPVELVIAAAVAYGGAESGAALGADAGAMLHPGSQFWCLGRPYLPEPALNPFEYDPRAALGRDGAAVRLRVEVLGTAGGGAGATGAAVAAVAAPAGAAVAAVRVSPWNRLRYAPLRLAAASRRRLEGLFDRHLSPVGSAMARALLLGDRGGLSDDLKLAFERSGSLHLMAVSGLHVGFLAGVIGLACAVCGVSGRGRNLAVSGGTALFVLITGVGPAVLRAAVMLCAGLWHPEGRRGSAVNSLGLAALLVLVVNPLQVAEAGLQLSFAATLGIASWAAGARGTGAAGRVQGALAASCGAQACSLPVLLHHFYRFSPWSPLTNLVLLPLGGGVISVLFAVSCASLLLPPVFALLGRPVDLLLRLLAGAAGLLGRLPGSLQVVGRPSPAVTLAVLACVVHLSLSGRPLRSRRALAATVALILLCLQPVWLYRPRPGLEVSFFAVGQGDAALVRCAGQAVLVDFGAPPAPGGTGPSRFTRCVLPFLQATRCLPTLGILSHPHADHIGGLAHAMQHFPGMRVLVRDCFESAAAGWLGPDGERLRRRLVILTQEGSLSLPAARNASRFGSLVLELFWAPGLDGGAHVNELSCAVRVRCAAPQASGTTVDGAGGGSNYGAGVFLFAGDLGLDAETQLVAARRGLLGADVLKVGHHGSGGSTGEAFLRVVAPALAVISVGHNGFGHPSRDCIDRLARAGAAVLRTDQAGWVSMRVSGGRVRVETFR